MPKAIHVPDQNDYAECTPSVLVLCPKRDMVIQVVETCIDLLREIPEHRVVAMYGGPDRGIDFKNLKRGTTIIVATPGRY